MEARNPDVYREWEIRQEEQDEQEEQEEEDPEEVEFVQSEEEDTEEVELVQSKEEFEYDQEGDEIDGEQEGSPTSYAPAVPASLVAALSAVPAPRGQGWTVINNTRVRGDNFFHRRLLRLLRGQYGFSNVGVEYNSEWWTHPRYRCFWRTAVHIRVSNARLRAAREESVHYAISNRDTQEAGIADVARQALYVYREIFFKEIQYDHDRWYPRREHGETACRIASTADVASPELASTVALVATLNTELDAVSDENRLLRDELAETQPRVAVLEQHLGGPVPLPTEFLSDSLPRKRTHDGSLNSCTAVDP